MIYTEKNNNITREKLPIISVIVPVYNTSAYLDECLISILGQTYGSIEVIVVDDGSVDDSPAIIARYAADDPRINIITKPNGGLSSARNAGLHIAHGEFICFVDSDDYLPSDALSTLYELITSSGADFVSGSFMIVNETKVPVELKSVGADNKWDWINHTAWSKLYRRDFLKAGNLSFIEGLWYEDVIFGTSCMSRASSVVFTEKIVYYYRRRSGSIYTGRGKKVLC